MRVSAIRKNGKKLTYNELLIVRTALEARFREAGFKSGCDIIRLKPREVVYDPTDVRRIIREIRAANRPPRPKTEPALQLKIGLHMCSFRVDVAVHGHNARIESHYKTVSGYKRTDVPTWNQRVEFNDLVNDVFDEFELSASIRSGCFIVRDRKTGRRNEDNWHTDSRNASGFHSTADRGIMPEDEARDSCNSDEREAEARKLRNAAARAKRAAAKLAKGESHE